MEREKIIDEIKIGNDFKLAIRICLGIAGLFILISIATQFFVLLALTVIGLTVALILALLPKGKIILTKEKVILILQKKILFFGVMRSVRTLLVKQITTVSYKIFRSRKALMIRTANGNIVAHYKFNKNFHENLMQLLEENNNLLDTVNQDKKEEK